MSEWEDERKEVFNLCPHGRLRTAFCEPCASDKHVEHKSMYPGPNGWEVQMSPGKFAKKMVQPDGSDAKYYDFPEGLRTTMDMIEWLNLDFSNGNILKSLIREHNPDAKKETTSLYEAQKRFYYAERNLRRVSKMQETKSSGE